MRAPPGPAMSWFLDWLLELILDIAACVYSRDDGWRPLHIVLAAAAVIALLWLARWSFG